jgi:hypothetical protein
MGWVADIKTNVCATHDLRRASEGVKESITETVTNVIWEAYRLTTFLMTWYKELGHENHKKGLGVSALAPSFTRSGSLAAGSERPARGMLWFFGVLLLQEPYPAFVTFLDALLPHVQGAPLGFREGVYVQCFPASSGLRADHSSSFNLRSDRVRRATEARLISLPSGGQFNRSTRRLHPPTRSSSTSPLVFHPG